MSGLAILCVVLVAAALIYAAVPKPGRNVERCELHRWTKSLLRLYSDSSLIRIRIVQSGAPAIFHLIRSNGDGSRCTLLLQVSRTRWSEKRLALLRGGYAEAQIEFTEPKSGSALLSVPADVPNIWSDDAGAGAVRIVHQTLEALSIPRDARFDLKLIGDPATERRLETLRRIREGSLSSW